jgi:hypothetical protein
MNVLNSQFKFVTIAGYELYLRRVRIVHGYDGLRLRAMIFWGEAEPSEQPEKHAELCHGLLRVR